MPGSAFAQTGDPETSFREDPYYEHKNGLSESALGVVRGPGSRVAWWTPRLAWRFGCAQGESCVRIMAKGSALGPGDTIRVSAVVVGTQWHGGFGQESAACVTSTRLPSCASAYSARLYVKNFTFVRVDGRAVVYWGDGTTTNSKARAFVQKMEPSNP
jgi:hypothetical protein